MCKVDEEPWPYTFCIRGVIRSKLKVIQWNLDTQNIQKQLYTLMKVPNDFHSILIYYDLGFNLSTSLNCFFQIIMYF
jgi:hypothetical protein